MPFRRSVKIFWQEGVTQYQYDYVESGIRMFLEQAQASNEINVQTGRSFSENELGCFRYPIPGRFENIFYGNAVSRAFRKLRAAQKGVASDYYSVIIFDEDLVWKQGDDFNFVGGLGSLNENAIICAYKTKGSTDEYHKKCVQAVTVHELGHVFDVFKTERGDETYDFSFLNTRHCAFDCVMNPYMYDIIDSIDLNNPFCEWCLEGVLGAFR